MFLESVHLKQNHWSFKLLQFTFPWISRFYNFCPHFWLTILAIAIFPITLMVRIVYHVVLQWLIVKPIEKVVGALVDFADKKFLWLNQFEQDLAMMDHTYWQSTDDKYRVFREFKDNIPKCESRKLHKYVRFFYRLNDDKRHEMLGDFEKREEEALEELRKRIAKYRKQEEKKRQKQIEQEAKRAEAQKRKRNRKPSMAVPRMMLAGKAFGIGILIPATIGVLYYLVIFLGWLWYWIVYYYPIWSSYWDEALIILGVIAICVGLVVGLWKLGAIINTKLGGLTYESCEKWRRFFRTVFAPFIWVYKLIKWFVLGIKDAFVFLWNGLSTFKSNNCPEIIWEDKNETKTS